MLSLQKNKTYLRQLKQTFHWERVQLYELGSASHDESEKNIDDLGESDDNEDSSTNDEKTVEAALNWPPSHFLN